MGRKNLIKRTANTLLSTVPYKITTLYSEQAQSLNTIQYPILTSLSMPAIKQNIERIKLTAGQASCAVLANNQIGKDTKLFVINNKIEEHKKWVCESYKLPNQYQCYINASIIQASNPAQYQQISVSFPFIETKILRYENLLVRYQNSENKTIQQQLTGHKAAAFQQAHDYSLGRHLLDWRLNQGNIKIQQDIRERLPKTTSVLEQYSKELQNMIAKYPKMVEMPQKIEGNEVKWFQNRGVSQTVSIEEDYLIRIAKHYRKEMLLLLERLQNNLI